MSRAGRRRKLDQNRHPSGHIVEKLIVNSVVLDRRMKAAKDIRADEGSPLSVLFHLHVITQDQHDAGSDLAARYWRLFGKPFGRVADLNGVRGRDTIDGVRALRDEIGHEQAIRALDRLGRNTRRIVLDCCVHLTWTPSAHHVEQLRNGLETLFQLPRPRTSETEKDRARAEMVA